MSSQRPIIISIVQYQAHLESGKMTAIDLVNKAATLGVDGVELRREPWAGHASEVSAVRSRLVELGLLGTYGSFSTLFNQDEAAHQQMLDDIATAAQLGAPLVRLFPGATPADDDRAGWERAEQAVQKARDLRVQIALENYARTPGGTLAEVRHILDRIQSPALRANIDIGNYPLHNQDVLEAIEAIGDRAIYVHVKDYAGSPDAEQPALGEGVLPLAEIFAALDALPQRIIYCFEFAGGDDPDGRIRRALDYVGQIRGK